MRGVGKVFQRGSIWWIRYSWRGKQYRESSGSETKQVAIDLLSKRVAERQQGRLIGPKIEKTSFVDLCKLLDQDYKMNARRSRPQMLRRVKCLKKKFGMMLAIDVTPDKVTKYIIHRQAQKAAAATIRLELAALGRMYSLGVEAGKVAHRPRFPTIAVNNARKGFFEKDQFEAVVSALPEYLKPLVRFLYVSGWRVGEARALRWRDVNLHASVARLEGEHTKNRKARTLPFGASPVLADLFKRQRHATTAYERRTGKIVTHVFHRNGRPIGSFRKAWAKACTDAKVPGRLVHDLRRTAVRNMVRAGVPQNVVMAIAGHKTDAMFRRYDIVDEKDLAAAMRKLAEI